MQNPSSSGIKSWAKDDRPREKLLFKGAVALSDTELLAILIHHGTADKSALDLAKEILVRAHHNLGELSKMSPKELMQVKGIGEAKAITIAAAMELSRRRQAGSLLEKPFIRSSQDAAQLLQPLLADHHNEEFVVLFLSQSNKLIHYRRISSGGMTGTVVDPKIIFQEALAHKAVKLLLCHNHPSGSLKASTADLSLTQKIKEAGQLLDIAVLDHLIVSDEGYFSFADEGLL